MDPYQPTMANVLARVGAWHRGLLRRYRRPIFVIGAAAATLAVGVAAGQAPAPPQEVAAR